MTSLVASPLSRSSSGFVRRIDSLTSLMPRVALPSYLLSRRREPLSLSLWRVNTFCVLCFEPWKPPGEKYYPSSAVSARDAVSYASMMAGPSRPRAVSTKGDRLCSSRAVNTEDARA